MRRTRQEARLRGWLEALPDEVIRVRPVLSVYFAGTLLISGGLDGVEGRLRDAERWLEHDTAFAHPVEHAGGSADAHASQLLVRIPARYPQQIVPIFVLRVGIGER